MILKDEIKTIVRRVLNREMWPDYATNQILALIDGQRCEWTQKTDNDWTTGCGKLMFSEHAMPDGAPFCPECGKKIKVKDDKRD